METLLFATLVRVLLVKETLMLPSTSQLLLSVQSYFFAVTMATLSPPLLVNSIVVMVLLSEDPLTACLLSGLMETTFLLYTTLLKKPEKLPLPKTNLSS